MSAPSRAAGGPLAGVRVLDFSAVVAGPMAAAMLADQGASVVKIEQPLGGDHGRYIGPGFDEFGALFAACNRNKRSLALDLRTPEGVAVVHRLAAEADVVIENFRAGVADRMGIGYEALSRLRPDLIYLSITGFGPDGPYAGQRAYDSVIQSLSGLADSQSAHGGQPALVSSIICDKATALTAAQAVAAALFARERGEGGRRIDVSLLDASLAFNWPDVMWNHTLLGEDFAPGPTLSETYRLWRTRDGHIAIVFIAEDAFRGWARALSAGPEIESETFADLKAQRARWEELVPLWESRLAAMTTEEALARLHAQSVPAGRVRPRAELMDDPQVRHNGALVEIDDPRRGRIRLARPGARFSGFEPKPPRCAPAIGGDSAEVLAEAGLAAAEIGALIESGVVRQG